MMGNLKLLPCEPEDALEIWQGHLAAFTNPREPFFFILFPDHEDSTKSANRMSDWWLGDESVRYMKVVDEESGAIISAAKWMIHENGLTKEEMNEVPKVDWQIDEDTNRWAEHIFHWVSQHRMEKTKGAPHMVLDMMSTHPDHHRKGAGTILMKWGTEKADSLGLDCYIDGTAIGRRLYESHGFKAEPTVVPVPEKWKHKPEIKYFFYVRTKKDA